MLSNRGKLLRSGFDDEEGTPDPMTSLGNLSDIMLVFACGLMVALIINLKVDIARLDEAVVRYESDSETTISESAGRGMDEIGKIYKDPKTGKTYIVDKENSEKIDGDGDEAANGEEAVTGDE